MEQSMLVTVANFTEPCEAHLFRTRLEAEGIPAFVAHEQHVGNNWPIGWALGGAKVQVLRDMADDARAVERKCIAGHYRRELLEELGEPEECCPLCGSTDFKSRAAIPKMLLLMAVFLITGIVFPLATVMRLCRVCGAGWRRQLAD